MFIIVKIVVLKYPVVMLLVSNFSFDHINILTRSWLFQ